MGIIAGSLIPPTDLYLHAGYLSACPRPFGYMGIHYLTDSGDGTGTLATIDVAQALSLKGPSAQPEVLTGQAHARAATQSLPPLPSGSLLANGMSLAFVMAFFLALAGLYHRRLRKKRMAVSKAILLGLTVVFLVLLGLAFTGTPDAQSAWGMLSNNWPGVSSKAAPPWEGVAVQEYADPRAATEVILHGIIINSLAGCSSDVRNLTQIQDEVAFPMPADEQTPGMAYALRTYGWDGWGRPFQAERLADGRWRVSSPGADGIARTDDDIACTTAKPSGQSWEMQVNGLYVRPTPAGYACFVHRVRNGLFRFAEREKASAAAGNDQFDMRDWKALWGNRKEKDEIDRLQGAKTPADGARSLYFLMPTVANNG